MILRPQDDVPLSDFKRTTSAHVRKLRKSGRPTRLLVNGKAAVVVQDAAAYEKILDELDRLQAIEGVRRGLRDVKAGRGEALDRVFDDIKRRARVRGRKRA